LFRAPRPGVHAPRTSAHALVNDCNERQAKTRTQQHALHQRLTRTTVKEVETTTSESKNSIQEGQVELEELQFA